MGMFVFAGSVQETDRSGQLGIAVNVDTAIVLYSNPPQYYISPVRAS